MAGERANFSFVVSPGETVTDTVRITNLGATTLELDLYAADAVLGDGAEFDLAGAEATPVAVGAWVELPEDSVEIPAGEGVDVEFELTVPEGADPGDRTGGIVTSLTTEGTDESGREVVTELRLVSRVQVRVAGPVDASLAVSDLTLDFEGSGNPASSGRGIVTYTVTNDGNVRIGADQTVHVRGLFGTTGREAVLDDVPELLPGASIDVEVPIDGVWPTFRTTAEVELHPRVGAVGEGEGPAVAAATASTATATIPWPQLLVVAAIAVAWWWKRRSDRRRIDRAVAARLAADGTKVSDGAARPEDRVAVVDLTEVDVEGEVTNPT